LLALFHISTYFFHISRKCNLSLKNVCLVAKQIQPPILSQRNIYIHI
jgi:hypothetical protein